MAHDWELAVRMVDGDPITAAVRLAELGGPASSFGAVISAAGADASTLVVAAALAGTSGLPLLLLDGTGVPAEVISLLEADGATRVTVVGTGEAVADGSLATVASRGIDATSLSLAAADRTATGSAGPVVVAPTDTVLDGLAGAAAAGLLGAPLLLVGPTADPAVAAFLEVHGFDEGWAVGGPTLLPPDLLGHYGTLVG